MAVITSREVSRMTSFPKISQPDESVCIQWSDISSWMDREKVKSRHSARRKVVENAHSVNIDHEPNPQKPPATAPPGGPGAPGEYDPIKMGILTSNYSSSAPSSPSQYLCLRSESAKNELIRPYVGSMPRNCCDVLGPTLCNSCIRAQRRHKHLLKSTSNTPTLSVSERMIRSTVLLKRYFPLATEEEIVEKIAKGDVQLDNAYDIKRPDKQCDGPSQPRSPFRNTYYFCGLADLNDRIVRGKLPPGITISKYHSKGKDPLERRCYLDKFPTFISSRNMDLAPKSKYGSYYTPPLLSKAKQCTEPMFFAGSDIPYNMPERLPDDIHDIIGPEPPDDVTWGSSKPGSGLSRCGSAESVCRRPSRTSVTRADLIQE